MKAAAISGRLMEHYLITPPDKSASNSPHSFSYSIITMPPQAKNLLLRSPNPFLALLQIKRQSPPPNKVSSRPGDFQLLFKLNYFWKARNNSKGDILLGLEMLMIDEESLFIQSANTSNTSAWNTEKTKNHQYHKEGTIVAVINVDTS
ncbi:hypothetical protein YC2023_088903 [Brassica napus]